VLIPVVHLIFMIEAHTKITESWRCVYKIGRAKEKEEEATEQNENNKVMTKCMHSTVWLFVAALRSFFVCGNEHNKDVLFCGSRDLQ
jgi:hypothetical protein